MLTHAQEGRCIVDGIGARPAPERHLSWKTGTDIAANYLIMAWHMRGVRLHAKRGTALSECMASAGGAPHGRWTPRQTRRWTCASSARRALRRALLRALRLSIDTLSKNSQACVGVIQRRVWAQPFAGLALTALAFAASCRCSLHALWGACVSGQTHTSHGAISCHMPHCLGIRCWGG